MAKAQKPVIQIGSELNGDKVVAILKNTVRLQRPNGSTYQMDQHYIGNLFTKEQSK